MDVATQSHLAALRDLLIYRLGELRADLHAAELAAADSRDRAPGLDDVHDMKDAAAQKSDLELVSVQRRRDEDELSLVEAALQRLDAGTYGDCAACGEPIALARLQAQPAAPRCAGCQAAFEKASRRA